jgi:hypothetical protein
LRRDGRGPVQQGLAAQAFGEHAGFADCCLGGFGVVQPPEMLGVVEQAMSQVVGSAQFGGRQRVRQVAQRASQGGAIAGLLGQPRALAVVGDGL